VDSDQQVVNTELSLCGEGYSASTQRIFLIALWERTRERGSKRERAREREREGER